MQIQQYISSFLAIFDDFSKPKTQNRLTEYITMQKISLLTNIISRKKQSLQSVSNGGLKSNLVIRSNSGCICVLLRSSSLAQSKLNFTARAIKLSFQKLTSILSWQICYPLLPLFPRKKKEIPTQDIVKLCLRQTWIIAAFVSRSLSLT